MITADTRPPYMAAKPTKKTYLMGIDPDVDKSGAAIWSRLTDGYTLLETLDFAALMQAITYYSPDELLIVVEAGHLNNSVWHFPPGIHTWKIHSAVKIAAEIGRRVGMNASAGIMIQHFCRANGYEVIEYRPTTPKWTADYFKQITGLPKGHNQEIRDACRCIHGR